MDRAIRAQPGLDCRRTVPVADPDVVQESTDRLKVLTEELALLMSSQAQLQTMLG